MIVSVEIMLLGTKGTTKTDTLDTPSSIMEHAEELCIDSRIALVKVNLDKALSSPLYLP